jgi:CBS domain-containing protein
VTVGEVCTRSVTALVNDTVADSARRMRDRHVGTLVVVDDEAAPRPIGILTDRDIVVSAVAQSPDKLEVLCVGDLMTPEPVTARSGETLDRALGTMRSRGIHRLPVVTRDGLLEAQLAIDDALEVVSDELCELVGLVARNRSASGADKAEPLPPGARGGRPLRPERARVR